MAKFLERKIRTLFTRFDMDGNGAIEEDDFDRWSEKLVSLGNLSSVRADALRIRMKQIWRTYFLPADSDKNGSVEFDELLTYMKTALADQTKRQEIKDTLLITFDAVDIDHDGGITIKEFSNYFKSLGLEDAAFASSIFTVMDFNGNLELSKEEFCGFGHDFFLSSDESSPSKHFFGPLVD